MGIVQLAANMKPALLMRRMLKHQGDVSEMDKRKPLAIRTMLGRKVWFYSNGEHVAEGVPLTDEEFYNSEVLRFAHASLLVGEAVGDKRKCYVDATTNPVEIWVYGVKAEEFAKRGAKEVARGTMAADELFETNPLPKLEGVFRWQK